MAKRRDGQAWKGVNLGGWLLLEPGPAHALFEQFPDPQTKQEARCEWDLLQIIHRAKGKEGAAEVLRRHRETHTTKQDFEQIKAVGMNAVRLPIGYWILQGPGKGEPYIGPALEYVDHAVKWAEDCGLQIVLDLHGCPGGESGEAPCGRRQRPDGTWHWRQWRVGQSLRAVKALAERYSARKCVTGIAVCNEPSNTIPIGRLCTYYEKAIRAVRDAGMPDTRVAVVLPLFQRPEDAFIQYWNQTTGGLHKNVCFDVHCYHCFENEFNGKTLAQHLRAVEDNADMLRRYPMVVGEWSLALGVAAWSTCGHMNEEQVYKIFASAQLEALKQASHGSFFWNWSERCPGEWNYQRALARGFFGTKSTPMPAWSITSDIEDPLEELMHPSPPEPRVLYGDSVYLRTFYGRYIDVVGSGVDARWPDKGDWQRFTFLPPVKTDRAGQEVRDGDVVRLQANNGSYLSVTEDSVCSIRRATCATVELVVHLKGATGHLRHRGIICLQSRVSNTMLDADADSDGLSARWDTKGTWQEFAVEKELPEEPVAKHSPAKTPRSTPKRTKIRRDLGTASASSLGTAAHGGSTPIQQHQSKSRVALQPEASPSLKTPVKRTPVKRTASQSAIVPPAKTMKTL